MMRNKAIVWVLVMALVVTCFPTLSFAADDVGEAIFYNRTYDEEGMALEDGLMVVPKSNSIALEKEGDNQYIKIQMANPVSEDCYIAVSYTHLTLPTKRIV